MFKVGPEDTEKKNTPVDKADDTVKIDTGKQTTPTPQEGQPVSIKVEDEEEPIPFKNNYKRSGCCGRLFYSYIWPLIKAVRENNWEMKEEMIEDMRLSDDET